eukprot:TRINITY_DN6577_c1_g1_i7.p1 TRINITY_DN6577_c1_g1~~TRINITY_DN6577_c1_g1_i7.p1  ORF type:complete len:1097 (-),score=264.73 TRINITY_DN6577_c1_g1_i7:45-3272(-)
MQPSLVSPFPISYTTPNTLRHSTPPSTYVPPNTFRLSPNSQLPTIATASMPNSPFPTIATASMPTAPHKPSLPSSFSPLTIQPLFFDPNAAVLHSLNSPQTPHTTEPPRLQSIQSLVAISQQSEALGSRQIASTSTPANTLQFSNTLPQTQFHSFQQSQMQSQLQSQMQSQMQPQSITPLTPSTPPIVPVMQSAAHLQMLNSNRLSSQETNASAVQSWNQSSSISQKVQSEPPSLASKVRDLPLEEAIPIMTRNEMKLNDVASVPIVIAWMETRKSFRERALLLSIVRDSQDRHILEIFAKSGGVLMLNHWILELHTSKSELDTSILKSTLQVLVRISPVVDWEIIKSTEVTKTIRTHLVKTHPNLEVQKLAKEVITQWKAQVQNATENEKPVAPKAAAQSATTKGKPSGSSTSATTSKTASSSQANAKTLGNATTDAQGKKNSGHQAATASSSAKTKVVKPSTQDSKPSSGKTEPKAVVPVTESKKHMSSGRVDVSGSQSSSGKKQETQKPDAKAVNSPNKHHGSKGLIPLEEEDDPFADRLITRPREAPAKSSQANDMAKKKVEEKSKQEVKRPSESQPQKPTSVQGAAPQKMTASNSQTTTASASFQPFAPDLGAKSADIGATRANRSDDQAEAQAKWDSRTAQTTSVDDVPSPSYPFSVTPRTERHEPNQYEGVAPKSSVIDSNASGFSNAFESRKRVLSEGSSSAPKFASTAVVEAPISQQKRRKRVSWASEANLVKIHIVPRIDYSSFSFDLDPTSEANESATSDLASERPKVAPPIAVLAWSFPKDYVNEAYDKILHVARNSEECLRQDQRIAETFPVRYLSEDMIPTSPGSPPPIDIDDLGTPIFPVEDNIADEFAPNIQPIPSPETPLPPAFLPKDRTELTQLINQLSDALYGINHTRHMTMHDYHVAQHGFSAHHMPPQHLGPQRHEEQGRMDVDMFMNPQAGRAAAQYPSYYEHQPANRFAPDMPIHHQHQPNQLPDQSHMLPHNLPSSHFGHPDEFHPSGFGFDPHSRGLHDSHRSFAGMGEFDGMAKGEGFYGHEGALGWGAARWDRHGARGTRGMRRGWRR